MRKSLTEYNCQASMLKANSNVVVLSTVQYRPPSRLQKYSRT